jgi:hypothetical protein
VRRLAGFDSLHPRLSWHIFINQSRRSTQVRNTGFPTEKSFKRRKIVMYWGGVKSHTKK